MPLKSSRKCRSIFNTLSLFLFLAIYSSCLDVHTEFTIRKNGKVDIDLEYRFDQKSADFGRGFGSDEPWPLPLTEKDFILQTIRHGEVVLKRYRTRHLSDGNELILVRLQAESIEAAMEFFGWEVNSSTNDEDHTMNILLPSVNPVVKTATREMLRSMLTDHDFLLRMKPPSKPTKVVGGKIENASGVFNITLEELVFSGEPRTWSVSW